MNAFLLPPNILSLCHFSSSLSSFTWLQICTFFLITPSLPSFSLSPLFLFPSCIYRLLHPSLSFPFLRLSPGCHSARLLVGLPGHPTEGVGLHQLLHLYVTPAGDKSILTAAQLRYTHLLASPGSMVKGFYSEKTKWNNYIPVCAFLFKIRCLCLSYRLMAGMVLLILRSGFSSLIWCLTQIKCHNLISSFLLLLLLNATISQ